MVASQVPWPLRHTRLPQLRMASEGLLPSPRSPGNPQLSHNVLVINSLIGFAFAEIAHPRWAPSAPCTGLAARGRVANPPVYNERYFGKRGTTIRPCRGPAAALDSGYRSRLPNSTSPFTTHQTPAKQPPLPGIPQPWTRLRWGHRSHRLH